MVMYWELCGSYIYSILLILLDLLFLLCTIENTGSKPLNSMNYSITAKLVWVLVKSCCICS